MLSPTHTRPLERPYRVTVRIAHPNGVRTNGVDVLVDFRQRDETALSLFGRVAAFAGGLVVQGPRLEYCVVIHRPAAGDIARLCSIRRHKVAERIRSNVVADLQALGARDATDAECREILRTRVARGPSKWKAFLRMDPVGADGTDQL